MLDTKAKSLAKITVKSGKQAGASFDLSEKMKKVLGRDNNCDIQVLDKGISRNHSLLEHKGDHFLLVDLGSTNGTFVNDKIIISKILESGDIIKIGQTEILYEEVEEKSKTSPDQFIQDEFLTHSPNTIMERVDVDVSLCGISREDLKAQIGGQSNSSEATYLSTIYEVSNIINAEQDEKKLFNGLIDKITSVFKPDRAFLVMLEDEEYHIATAKNARGGDYKISKTILKKTVQEGVSVLSGNAVLDDGYSDCQSIVTQQIKSVMCVPLESRDKILGAIYIDSLGGINRFKKGDLELLAAIGRQAGVAIERTQLFDQVMEKEKLKQEMEIAQKIQKSLLPSSIPENFEYDLVGWNRSCDDTGGDYYDFFELDDGRLACAIGDVTGHGIGAAFLMATGRAFLKALAHQNKEIPIMMNELNNLLERDMADDKFMTLFYGEIDSKKMILRYANAGHDCPMLYRRSQDKFEQLESTGIPLGMMEDYEYEEAEPVQINPGDILVLSTDGITEAMNTNGDQFGEEKLIEIIRNFSAKSANQIIKECHDAVAKFCGTAPQRDDLTLVVFKFNRRA